jgi:hypothetical protein
MAAPPRQPAVLTQRAAEREDADRAELERDGRWVYLEGFSHPATERHDRARLEPRGL